MYNLLAFADVLKSVGGVLLAVMILLVMVSIHEFGHYVAGKILNFKINEFSVGFGPAIFKKRSKKTGELFALRAIPLGGYCAFDGEDDFETQEQTSEQAEEENGAEIFADVTASENVQPIEKSEPTDVEKTEEYPEPTGVRFNDQAPWKRIIVLVAGATMNYLLALLLIILMFATLGQPMYKIAEPREGKTMSAVYEVGDIIESIDGQNVYMITDYMDALSGKKAGDTVTVGVIRGNSRVELELNLEMDANFVNMSDTGRLLGALGLDGLYTVTVQHGFFDTIGRSFAYSWKIGGTVLRSLGELLTGKLGLDAMGGPVTTITVTAQAASSSTLQFLNIAALIGVNLAVFNLLPVPALDGSKVVFCLIEWMRKKPINRNVETIIHFIGLIVLFGFAILVDLLRLF
ncbi:MAG: PDZ domain-containing protein [Clostridiales bacterium]|nr:PDZ domain-containing protein [Clostridiales bacterium]